MWRGNSRRTSETEEDFSWLELSGSAIDTVPCEPTALHAMRIDTVLTHLLDCGSTSVADLGCGGGLLVQRLLAHPGFHSVVGVDVSAAALWKVERDNSAEIRTGRLRLIHGSFTDPHQDLLGLEAVAMVETIEHIPPSRLSRLERWLFEQWRPSAVVITTPNQEYNVLFGMAPGQMREPGHCFEWPRARFRQWACGVAMRHGYALELFGIGDDDPRLGSPTQAARFRRLDVRHLHC
jgi:small RNA 2'-O-methyltransferase